MFKIHRNQMAACSEISRQSFADRVTRHLVEKLPAPCAALGTPALRGAVERGITRAASHGIVARKDVCLFLAVTSALGEGFEADPKLSFAADILGEDNPLDAATKVRTLWTVVESEFLPEGPGASDTSAVEPSVAIAVELAEAAETDLAGPLPLDRPVVPCPLRARVYPFSL